MDTLVYQYKIFPINQINSFKSNCGRYYLVYNGELWNSTFQEWDKYLRERYDFVTKKSDTELLLYFLIHHKDDLVTQLPKLNGMFSFGFYDNIEDTLILGRDFIGRIPLHFYHDGTQIIFCSEVKPLLVERKELQFYRSIKNKDIPKVKDKIQELKGGNLLVYNGKDGSIQIQEYYRIKRYVGEENPTYPKTIEELKIVEDTDKGIEYYSNKLSDLLDKSIDDELISDVPISSILSGGIDSSIITYLISKRIPNIECFVVSVKTDSKRELKDDLYYSRFLSKHLGLRLHELIITKDDITRFLEDGVLGSEYNNWVEVSSSVPQILLSNYIRKKGFKVVFGGDGSDELFVIIR